MSTIDVEEKIKLEVKNLNFYYGSFHALKSVNLSIPEKRSRHLLGPQVVASRRCCACSTKCLPCIPSSVPKGKS